MIEIILGILKTLFPFLAQRERRKADEQLLDAGASQQREENLDETLEANRRADAARRNNVISADRLFNDPNRRTRD